MNAKNPTDPKPADKAQPVPAHKDPTVPSTPATAPGGVEQSKRGGRRRARFDRPVAERIKPHREGTKRARVVAWGTRPEGFRYEELSEVSEWDHRTTYEGIILVHKILGYGLYETADGVIRVFSNEKERQAFIAKAEKNAA